MGFLRFLRRYNHPFQAKIRYTIYPLQHIHRRGFSKAGLFKDNDALLPVLIIGAGPVGLVLSILLTNLGIKCAVLERNETFSRHPQAHFINNRSMEIFRKIDGLVEEIQRSQPPVDLWRKFIYCTSLSGSILGSVDHIQPQGAILQSLRTHFQSDTNMKLTISCGMLTYINIDYKNILSTNVLQDIVLSLLFYPPEDSYIFYLSSDLEHIVSPVSVAHFSQYKLTTSLLKQLENLGFRICSESLEGNEVPFENKIMMGHECVSIDAHDDYVTVTASLNYKGKRVERNIQCKLLVGTDGAGSTVRKLAGIEMRGEKDLQKLVSVHFMSKCLGQFLLEKNPGMLFFIFNTEAIGVLVAHDLRQGEFVLQIPFYPPQQTMEDFSSKACEKLISKLVGLDLGAINVIDTKPWIMHAEVAEKFICCGNHILLAGDAAHRFPPAGGFGMNTGIQDAHNLAWKIASVIEGIAPSSILNTYETERRPIAIFNTELSLKNYRAAMAVPAALGLEPTVANSVHQLINNGIGSILPSGLQKVALDGIFAIGRAQLSKYVLNESNPLGSSRLAKLRQIFEEGKSLQLQFPAEDLGYRYLQGAIVPDSNNTNSPLQVPTGRRREYISSANPGSRLPHMYVRVNLLSEIVSTLDLVSGGKVEFLLIIAPVTESYHLAHAAFKVAEDHQVSVRVCVIWSDGSIKELEEGSKAALSSWQNYVDVVEVKRSSTSNWWDMCNMTDRGAILVRPDEHVAWRTNSGLAGDPIMEMQRVFSAVLGINSKSINS